MPAASLSVVGTVKGAFLAMDMDQVSDYIKTSKNVLDILKTLGSLLPKGPQAEEAQRQLEQAEKALQASEAQLAQSLGYELCQCTFPPQIMLSKKRHHIHDKKIFECPGCGQQEPSETYFKKLDRLAAHNEREHESSWTAARRGR